MAIYEIAIAVKDKEGKRKKEGDMVAVIPHGAQWGSAVIDEYLIVLVETSMTLDEMRKMCAQRVYRRKSNGEIISAEELQKLVESEDGESPSNFEVHRKNRYSIPMNGIKTYIPDLDMAKVQDETCKYQPFKTASKLVEGFDGKDGHNYLDKKDMDTTCSVAGKEQEFVINLNTSPPLILDTLTGKKIK